MVSGIALQPGLLDSSLGCAPGWQRRQPGVSISPSSEEVGWAWQHVVDCLDQEFYPVRFSFPQLGPCDLAL